MADTHSRNASESQRSLLGGEGDEGVLGTALTVETSLLFFESMLKTSADSSNRSLWEESDSHSEPSYE